jgi:hypothetical protein
VYPIILSSDISIRSSTNYLSLSLSLLEETLEIFPLFTPFLELGLTAWDRKDYLFFLLTLIICETCPEGNADLVVFLLLLLRYDMVF